MNWDNKELNRLTDDLASILDDADEIAMGKNVDRETNRKLAASFLEYAYALGKSDGRTEGILAMSHKGVGHAA